MCNCDSGSKCISEMDKTFLEFFAGIGLVRRGLEEVGWKCVFANDNDPKKVRIYKDNLDCGEIKEANIKNLRTKDVPSAVLATACFPCHDLSEAGSQNGIRGPQSGVFWSFVRILRNMEESRPKIVLLENVRGFLTVKKGRNIVLATRALNKLGYFCDVLMIDAKHFVPQSRPRVFVIGCLQDSIEGLVQSNPAEIKRHQFRTEPICKLMENNPRLKWFNLDLPTPPQSNLKLAQILDPPEKVPLNYWFNETEVKRHEEMIPSHHKDRIDPLIENRESAVFTMYRRMRKGMQKAEIRFDEIAGCLRSARGGSSKQFLVIIENGKLRIRKLTIPELRRLMEVPLDFRLPSEYSTVYSALGDAVVVSAIVWVAKNILNPLYDQMEKSY